MNLRIVFCIFVHYPTDSLTDLFTDSIFIAEAEETLLGIVGFPSRNGIWSGGVYASQGQT